MLSPYLDPLRRAVSRIEFPKLHRTASHCSTVRVSERLPSGSYTVLCWGAGCPTGNGEELICSQAQPVQANNSAVACFPSISCGASCAPARYIVCFSLKIPWDSR